MTTSLAIQLAASVATLVAMWLMGNKKPMGPVIAVASEFVWLALIFYAKLWGILPLTAALLVIHTRNAWKWRKEQ